MMVHRRVGGLENETTSARFICTVHRRVGGLEKTPKMLGSLPCVHRRVGGLEILHSSSSSAL